MYLYYEFFSSYLGRNTHENYIRKQIENIPGNNRVETRKLDNNNVK